MVEYRTFRNADPPRILELWNAVSVSRGCGKPAGCDALETMLFSRPYFDREGLILAFEGDQLIGMAHAAFGSDADGGRIDRTQGVVCALLVRPEFRRHGVGGDLLSQANRYLADRGARNFFAGSFHPMNPFYLGLYGGSESPGILDSDLDLVQFVTGRGYQAVETCRVYQRTFESPPTADDSRLPLLRREMEILAEPWPMPASWWQACTVGPFPSLRYEMLEKQTREFVGETWAWDMETYTRASGTPTIGLVNFSIEPSRRRHGFATLLLQSVLKHLMDQGVSRVEVQTMEQNVAAIGLYEKFGFQLIDVGRAYLLDSETAASVVEGASLEKKI